MKRLLKISSILGIATLVRIFSGAARAKFLAWQLGPLGVGLIGQAVMYSAFTIQLCSLNMCMGITKEISEDLADKKRKDRVGLVINTAHTLQFLASACFVIMALPFSGILSKFLFSGAGYQVYFIGITLAAPLAIYLVGIADPVFYGFKKIAEYTKLSVIYTVIGLFSIIVLVYFYKTEGMFLQIILISAAGFLMANNFMRRKLGVLPKLDLSFYRNRAARLMSSRLFAYGLISFIPAIVGMIVLLYLRSVLMRQYGAEANGYYQVAYGISAYYLPFVTNALWGHFYPEMCALKSKGDINREMNQFIRFVLLISTAIAGICIIFRKYAILILFSAEFMKAYDLLAIQAVGDIFFVLFCMFSTALMARRKFKAVIALSTVGYNVILVSLYYIFAAAPWIGLKSLNMAIAVTNIALVAAYLVYSRLDTGFVLTMKNVYLFIKGAIFIAIIYLIPDRGFGFAAVKMALAAGWLVLSVSAHEAKKSADLAVSFFKKKALNG